MSVPIANTLRHDFSFFESPVDGRNADGTTVWRKEGYHGNYNKSPVLPDDREDITEYVELLAILDNPCENLSSCVFFGDCSFSG